MNRKSYQDFKKKYEHIPAFKGLLSGLDIAISKREKELLKQVEDLQKQVDYLRKELSK